VRAAGEECGGTGSGVETQLRPNLKSGAAYSGQFGGGLKDHCFKASLNWTF